MPEHQANIFDPSDTAIAFQANGRTHPRRESGIEMRNNFYSFRRGKLLRFDVERHEDNGETDYSCHT